MRLSHLSSWVTFATVACAVDTLVDLGYAKYNGVTFANGTTHWLGIRYAAPPLGDLRFAAPQDPQKETAIQLANSHGKVCLATGGKINSSTTSEDCLFLDVFAPSNKTAQAKLPVFVYIQGGGFNENSNPNYDGSGLVTASNMSIVVVTFNYRVGPWGFIAGREVQEGGSINNGLKDQRKVLEWVQDHISQFGGDPRKVTLGGSSAGGASITFQLSAYGGKDAGLFHATAAVSQSFAPVSTVQEAQYQYDNLVIRTGCVNSNNTLACLRGLDANSIQAVNFNTVSPNAQKAPLYMWQPTIDNDLIREITYTAFERGKFVKLPAIWGDDTNEGTVFAPNTTANISDSDIFLQAQFPKLSLEQLRNINAMYPVAEQFPGTGAYWRQVSNAYGELRYICPGIHLSNIYQSNGIANTYNYRWNVKDTREEARGTGVTHTVEMQAIFGPEYTNGGALDSYFTYNYPMVAIIQGYWTSFIRTAGDPNRYRLEGTPTWEKWTEGSSYRRLKFEVNSTSMEDIGLDQQERCDYLIGIGPSIKQ